MYRTNNNNNKIKQQRIVRRYIQKPLGCVCVISMENDPLIDDFVLLYIKRNNKQSKEKNQQDSK